MIIGPDYTGCEDLYYVYTPDEGDDTTDGLCKLVTDEETVGDIVIPQAATGAFVDGPPGTPTPPSSSTVQIHGDEDSSMSSNSWPDVPNYYTSALSSYSSTSNGGWRVLYSSSDIGSLMDWCTLCAYNIVAVEVEDAPLDSAGECEEYTKSGLKVCWTNSSSSVYLSPPSPVKAIRKVPEDTACTPGSGRFRLLKTRQFDRDGDGNRTGVFRPVQVSGTGRLTSNARITSVSSTSSWGSSLKSIKGVNSSALIDTNDNLQAIVGQAFTITTNTHSISGSNFRGGTPFVLEEYQPGYFDPNIQVDLDWTCSPPLPIEEVSFEQGYTASFSDLGCFGSWPQTMTLRIAGNENSLSVEAYGFTDLKKSVSLSNKGAYPKHFVAVERGLEVEGDILSANATSMVLDLDKVEYMKIPFCQSGIYTLPVEQ